jgi:nitrogen fixation NifU-like protein
MDLRDLYQDIILDHGQHPRNFGKLDPATHHAHGHNPLCGDTVAVYLDVEDGRVKDVRFEGRGCAISTASASLMSEVIVGKRLDEVSTLFADFQQRATGHEVTAPTGLEDEVERLEPLTGVKAYPTRIKCAVLPWHTLSAALAGTGEDAKTEDRL